MPATITNTTTRHPRPSAVIIQFPRPAPPPTEEEWAARINAITKLWVARQAAEAAVAAARPSAKILRFQPRQREALA